MNTGYDMGDGLTRMRRGKRSKANDVTAPDGTNQHYGPASVRRHPDGSIMRARRTPHLTRGRTLLVPVLAAALAGADALSRATPSPHPPERGTPAMGARATVELVLIEAYVTDSQGRPLRGLG